MDSYFLGVGTWKPMDVLSRALYLEGQLIKVDLGGLGNLGREA